MPIPSNNDKPFSHELMVIYQILEGQDASCILALSLALAAHYPSLAGRLLEELSTLDGWDGMMIGLKLIVEEATGRY